MNIGSQVEHAISRLQEQLGQDFDVINYEFDPDAGDTPYADGDWVETETSPRSVNARIEFPDVERQRETADGSGANVESDATIYIETDEVSVTPGTADETRATEFVNTRTGVRYRTVDVVHQTYVRTVHVEEL